jgi:hypothetical protein
MKCTQKKGLQKKEQEELQKNSQDIFRGRG